MKAIAHVITNIPVQATVYVLARLTGKMIAVVVDYT